MLFQIVSNNTATPTIIQFQNARLRSEKPKIHGESTSQPPKKTPVQSFDFNFIIFIDLLLVYQNIP